MKNSGFSLVELVVVIALMMILMSIATINFNSWSRKNAIEAQVKELYSDITSVRLRAIQTKLEHRIQLNPTTFRVRSFASDPSAPIAWAAGTVVQDYESRVLKYQIRAFNAGAFNAFNNTELVVNDRGYFPNVGITIAVANAGSGEAALDCIVINTGRAEMGRINGNACVKQ